MPSLRTKRDGKQRMVNRDFPHEIKKSLGMRINQGPTSLEKGIRCDVVLRDVSETFWQESIEVVTSLLRTRVCAVGVCGIGNLTERQARGIVEGRLCEYGFLHWVALYVP